MLVENEYLSCSDKGTGRRSFGGGLGRAYSDVEGAAGFTKLSPLPLLVDSGSLSSYSSLNLQIFYTFIFPHLTRFILK